MKLKFTYRLLSISAFVLAYLLLTTCKKEENPSVNNYKVPEAFPGVQGELVSFQLGGDTITCEIINGFYIYQGDIILVESQLKDALGIKGNGWSSLSTRWPNSTVYYTIDKNFSDDRKKLINNAINEYNSRTNIKFVQREGNEPNYVEFVSSISGSYSKAGMVGLKQVIALDNADLSTILHEMGHTIGLYHEHAKKDRDEVIEVFLLNIDPRKRHNFVTQESSIRTSEFDWNSVMLYPSFTGWEIDKSKPSMTLKDNVTTWDARANYLSDLDIETINYLYSGSGPIAAFTASKTTIDKGESLQFTDLSSNNPGSWYWDFGDGSKSTVQNPVHQYNKTGTFSVTLKVVNSFDSYVLVKTGYISVIETLKDIDSNLYKTIKIGFQVWMAENLKVTKYNDGESIPLITDNTAWYNLTTPGYCWYNNNEATYKVPYGALYNWYTVNTGKLCPAGWHIPTYDEWRTLEIYLMRYDFWGLGTYISKSMASTEGWAPSSEEATIGNDQASNNSSGFTAFPAGARQVPGGFINVGTLTYLWSSTEGDSSLNYGAYSLHLSYAEGYTRDGYFDKRTGHSVRCIKGN